MKIDDGFIAQMREATRILQSEGPMAATAAIQRALHGTSEAEKTAAPAAGTSFLPHAPELRDSKPPHVSKVEPSTPS